MAAHRLACCLSLLAAVVGCQPKAPVANVQRDTTVVTLGTKTFKFHAADGRVVLGPLSLYVGGRAVVLRDGAFAVPEGALADAKRSGHPALIFAPGFVPHVLDPEAGGADITLVPVKPLGTKAGADGALAATDASAAVALPGPLVASHAGVALGAYVPAPASADPDAQARQRKEFLGGIASAPPACDDPLPCPPAANGLGLLLTVDGPVPPGPLTATFDLASPAYAENPAAQQILATAKRIDARPDRQAWWDRLKDGYGVTLQGSRLGFTVKLGDHQLAEGLAKFEVGAVGLLGGKVELTVVSAAGPSLPDGAVQPGMPRSLPAGPAGGAPLITNDGATIISNDGASLITNDGASLITNDGGSLISNDGGSLITNDGGSLITNDGGSLSGNVRVPFAPFEGAKYRLAAYTDYVWRDAEVSIAHKGTAAQWGPVDATGRYAFAQVPPGKATFTVIARAGTYRLATLVKSPVAGAVVANLDAATTAETCLALDALGVAKLAKINPKGFDADVAVLRAHMSQADAQLAVSQRVPAVAAMARGVLAAAGRYPFAFQGLTVSLLAGSGSPGAADGTGAAASFSSPDRGTLDPSGNLFITDRQNHTIRKITPGGVVTTVAGTPGVGGPADGPVGTGQLRTPRGLDFVGGVLAVADYGNNALRKVVGGSLNGGYALPGVTPFDVRVTPPKDALIVADYGASAIYRYDLGSGSMRVLAGQPGSPGFADGPAASARFNKPSDILLNGTDVYVGDTDNHAIRKIDAAGNVTTVAGNNGEGYRDGIGAEVRFVSPSGMCQDGQGNLYVADAGANAVRMVELATGRVTTVACASAGPEVAGPAAAGPLQRPVGLCLDRASKRLLIMDLVGNTVQVIQLP